MLSLYEILKASKTGIAPDMWTALAGMNWGGADSGHEVKELTGIPPLSFRADGTPLLDYLISGNTVQNGTPTPGNPVDVQGVGVRTENLFDGFDYFGTVPSISTGQNVSYANGASTDYIPIESPSVTLSKNQTYTATRIFIFLYDANKQFIGVAASNDIAEYSTNISGYADAKFCRVRCDYYEQYGTKYMLNTGSTAKPYEPYGYKIPISSGQQTTNIYLGSTQTTRQIKKFVLTGNDGGTWIRNEAITSGNAFLNRDIFIGYKANVLSGYCTHYPNATAITDTVGVFFGNNINFITAFSEGLDTVDKWYNYLRQQYAAGTPVTVWYVLATPETATVNEPLMKIGDYADTVSYEQAGVQIPTLHGNTVIDVETTPKPSQMYIKYQK